MSFFNAQQNDNLNYLSNGIVEDKAGKIITDKKLKENFLKDRTSKVFLENQKLKKAATPVLVEMCSNGGFEQIETVGGNNYLKNFLHTIGDPPGPTQCRSISNKADSYIEQYSPSANNLMATTVPSNLIDQYMGDIKAFDQYALKINHTNSSTYGSIVQGKRFKTNNENFLKFNYKAILQSVYDNSHTDNQAFFKARILNKSNVVVSEFCLVGDEKNCIFTKVPDGGYGYVTLYTANWQSGLLDISSIPNNEEFTVEFMASRCGLGGHFGYAYVDDICLLHSDESFVGSITLDPLNAVCPTLPINVSGVFTLPNSGGVTASVKNITLKLSNDAGTVVHTTQAAIIDNVNKKFNFVLNNTDIPNITQANYNVGVDINYDIQGSSCGGGNFFSNASDSDANEGWDISFLNCSSSCNIPVVTAKLNKCDIGQDGIENFNLTDLDSEIVNSTSGLSFTYFKNYSDAFNNSNAISGFTNYSSGTTTIYVRVSRDPSCYKIIPASLEVRNPTANITGILNVCSGSTELTAPAGSSYLWSHNNLTTQKITVTDVGVYSVTVIDSYGCSSTASVSIEPSVTAVSPTLSVTQPSCFVSSGTIKVTSPASEYSFDNGVSWTTNGTKANLYPGKYFIKIKTVKGCISYAQEVDIVQSLLPYPSAYPTQPRFCGDTATITVTTGAAYYSFDNGVTWGNNPVADKLQPGKYIVRTKDTAGCISNPQVVLIESQTLGNAEYTLVSPACSVLGSITIDTPSDFYTFDGGTTWGTSNVLNNVAAGNYSIGVKNYLGCISYYKTIYVNKFEAQSPEYEVIQPECGTDGTIYIKTEAAQYSFDNGVTWTTSNLAELPAGTYRIKIKNAANCISQVQTITLNPARLPYPIYTKEDPGCGVNGKITINSVHDFYSFDSGVTWVTTNSKILPAGTYFIMVKNSMGCKSDAQYVSLYEQKLPKPNFTVTQPTCTVKGSITITTVADYYSINGGSTWTTNPVFNNLSGYSYNIMIKNNLNCVSEAGYASFNQAYLENPTYTATSPSCGNTVGSVKFTSVADQYSVNGGSSWSTNPDFPNLSKGYYSLMVRKAGCTSNYISLYLDEINLAAPSVSTVQPSCGTKGSITVNAVADSYSIDGGYTWTASPVFNNLNSGYYNVVIKTGSCKSNITSVDLKQFYLDNPDYTFTQPSCGVGGSITITTPSSFYSIDGGSTWSSNPVFSNLQPKSYNIAIKNNLNCTSNLYSGYLTLNRYYLPKPDVEIVQPKCGLNGSIKIATPAAQYSFDNGNTWTTNPVLNNLTSGYYYIVIKNAQNCISESFSVSIAPYYLPRPMTKVVQPTCTNNGSITVVSNAAFYSFDNGATWGTSSTLLNPTPGYYSIKIKNSAGCISTATNENIQKYFLSSPQVTTIQPTCASPKGTIIVNTIADLYSFDNGTTWVTNPIKTDANSGSYYVLIKNNFGCVSQVAYANINSIPNIAAAPAVSVVQPTACDSTDGSIKINTTAVSYSFNDGASWTTNPVKNNLGSGTYIIKIKTNSYSCDSQTTIVNLDSGITIAAPDVLVTAPTCSVATGSITVTSAASTYSFDNGLTFTYSNTKSGLLPGTYKVKVKNASGCISNVATAVISTPAPLPAPLFAVNHPDCNNALGQIKITSAAAEFSFDNGLTFGVSDTKSNLSPGTYNLMIKDAAGCISLGAMVTINNKPITPGVPQVAITQPLGCTASTGSISVISPAGFYSFDDGATWSASSNVTLAPGTYLVRQKLTNSGCPSLPLSVTIDSPPDAPVLPVYSVNNPVSCTNPFGDITISTPSAMYSFDNGMTYSPNSNSGQLAPGTYQLKTKNSAGCESVAVLVTIKKPIDTPLMPVVKVQQLDCHHPSGEIIINTLGVQYSIDDGLTWSTSNIYQSLIPNTYNVRYKNAIGCISDPTQVVINSYVNTTPTPLAAVQQNFCIQNQSTIAEIKITGTSVKWYDSPLGGSLLPVTTLLVDGKTYFASQIVATCESNRIPVTVSILATSPPTGDLKQLFCISRNSKLSDINITGSAIKWYSDKVSTVSLPATTALQDSFTYYATQTVNGCESVLRTPITVNITSNEIPGLLGPEISKISIENANATVVIKGTSVYEYSLNNQNSWQDSNVYKDLPTGVYKVYVREKSNICAVSVKDFIIFKINNIITPNGDGVNDSWEIENLENYLGTIVRVIDKNGRIVLQKTVKEKFSWDGTFSGRPLPTDNYWYQIILTDGRLLTGFLVIKNRN
ncbi:T9SS type B sorting domain-containing protein [Epilithonimonas sp.]|uniref:T9SS type B sorting domain-containing protein n=1 Tax=Epilithonimonas sp. TaxID=2894511 RepID=UPI002FDED53A